MFNFISRWRLRAEPADQVDDGLSLPFPVTEKSRSKGRDLQLDTMSIGPPIPQSASQSLTGFDDHAGRWEHPQPSPSRAGPSQVAWLRQTEAADEEMALPVLTPPAPVRLNPSHIHPISRSVSSPPTSPSYETSSSSSLTASPQSGKQWNLRLHTNPTFSQSTQSLGLEARSYPSDLFGYVYSYPLVKQLSPIAEQDYFSPDSLRRTKPLPGGSDHNASPSISYSHTNPSPSGSHNSEITRPSPIYSHPFITRQLNRTISQTSSRTHISTKSAEPPIIPPLDLRPPFPGPHPSSSNNGPPLRPLRHPVATMPTISASSGGYSMSDDRGSLHAESFVTASDAQSLRPSLSGRPDAGMDITDVQSHDHIEQGSHTELAVPPSIRSNHSRLPSASESFISRRWDRDVGLGTGVVTFRAKRQWISSTPAFWAFWLGFVCPFLWLIGGWHFTHFGEQPPRLTFWEFYFNAGFLKEKFCGGRNKQKEGKGRAAPVPRWVAEKQSSDDGRARLNDPKRSLRGISFGYPFIPRPVPAQRGNSWWVVVMRRVVRMLEKPNRLFDQLYGVKLKEVRGRPESGRRIFDPWIQRCRYAFCYALILLCIGLCSTSSYLIIYNTRRLS